MINKMNLAKTFSNASRIYDRKAALQKEVARELSELIDAKVKNATKILDVGIGTGFLTEQIKQMFVKSDIYGLDLAFGMTEYVKERTENIRLVQADAENLPFSREAFDLVVSNLTYQWVENLELAFEDVSRVLKNRGKFYFTCFGKRTLQELRDSFCHLGLTAIDGTNLPSYKLIERCLRKTNFKNVEINCGIQKYSFNDLFDLVSWLKDIGANYSGNNVFIGRKKWQQANDFYCRNFRDNGSIFATFEVIWVVAKK